MKGKIIYSLILFAMLFACKEEKKIEIIPDYNSIYHTQNLSEFPILTQGSDEELTNKVKEYIMKNYSSEKDKIKLDYNFLVNENGTIDKIVVNNNLNSEVDNFVVQTISTWKFKPATKNGKVVKSQYNWKYYSGIYAPVADEKNYLIATEIMPEIVGGLKTLQEKIIYPESAKKAGVEGKVFVQAFIDESGNVINARVIKGIGSGCDEAALNAVKSLKFTPAKNQGKPVKVQVTIPIFFKLN